MIFVVRLMTCPVIVLILVSSTVQSSFVKELLVGPWYLAFRPGLRERRTPPEDLSTVVHAKYSHTGVSRQ
jgi:hypothetical protein